MVHLADDVIKPSSFDEFVGQKDLIESLRVYVGAAKMRGEILGHTLICGKEGLGKKTIAHIIANEMGEHMTIVDAHEISDESDLIGLLCNLNSHNIFVIENIHLLKPRLIKLLITAMKYFYVEVTIGRDATMRSIRIDLLHFTLIGLTDQPNKLPYLLKDQFEISLKIEPYKADQLKEIISYRCKVYNIEMDEEAKDVVINQSDGTPLSIIRLMRRIRDFSQFCKETSFDEERTLQILKFLS